MFRDGQYLEVIKASDTCLASVIVTVQERTVEIKKRKVSTNKWLELEDWAALYKILKKALIQKCSRNEKNSSEIEGGEKRKVTRQLDVTYTFESSNHSTGTTSLPTIRVNVSQAKRKLAKDKTQSRNDGENTIQNVPEKLRDTNNSTKERRTVKESRKESEIKESKSKTRKHRDSKKSKEITLEEYIPDTPLRKKHCPELKYIPSKKSTLANMQVISDEYSPVLSNNNSIEDNIQYVPNSLGKNTIIPQAYEPSSVTTTNINFAKYVPNSKGAKVIVEEYEPDFTSKLMKFDDSYVPSSTRSLDKTKKEIRRTEYTKSSGNDSHRKKSLIDKKRLLS